MSQFLNSTVTKERIHTTLLGLCQETKKAGWNCCVSVNTEFGYIDFGELYTRYPNLLYKQLKDIPGVNEVAVTITYDVA